MPKSTTRPNKIIIKGGKPRKFPPKPDYGGKPPGPENIRPKRMPEATTRQKERIIKGTGPQKFPPRPDYGGKPPGAYPVAPKPAQNDER